MANFLFKMSLSLIIVKTTTIMKNTNEMIESTENKQHTDWLEWMKSTREKNNILFYSWVSQLVFFAVTAEIFINYLKIYTCMDKK